MSLTTWVTDYLFTPLSMSLRSLGQTGLVICITLNMVIIGLWHGLTLNFLVFGLLHAVFVILTVLVNRKRAGSSPAISLRANDGLGGWLIGAALKFGGMALTFALVSFSTIFWHCPTWSEAMSLLGQTLGVTPSGPRGISDLGPSVVMTVCICAAVALYHGLGAPGTSWAAAQLDKASPRWLQYGACVFLLATLSTVGGKFVYGQF